MKTGVTPRATLLILILFRSDVTPPRVTFCPGLVLIKTDNEYELVNWDEPTFTDNVGIVSLIASKKPGHKMQRDTSLNVRYTATDAAENSAICDILVVVECKLVSLPASLPLSLSLSLSLSTCSLTPILGLSFSFPASSCPVITNLTNGNATLSDLQLHLKCHPGYYFNPKPPGAKNFTSVTYHCFDGKWKATSSDGSLVPMTSTPDCVGE